MRIEILLGQALLDDMNVEGGLIEVKPALVQTIRKFLEQYPNAVDEEFQTVLDKLRQEVDRYVYWAATCKDAPAASREVARICHKGYGSASVRRQIADQKPILGERLRLLKDIPVQDPDHPHFYERVRPADNPHRKSLDDQPSPAAGDGERTESA